jgi:hypothetical protein
MSSLIQRTEVVNPAAPESSTAADENIVEITPINDVFSPSFVSRMDPAFTSSSTSDHAQGDSAT